MSDAAAPPASFVATGWRRFSRRRLAPFALGFLGALALVCFLSPWLAPYDYKAQNLALGPVAPNAQHWFGTDLLGRDLFSRRSEKQMWN